MSEHQSSGNIKFSLFAKPHKTLSVNSLVVTEV